MSQPSDLDERYKLVSKLCEYDTSLFDLQRAQRWCSKVLDILEPEIKDEVEGFSKTISEGEQIKVHGEPVKATLGALSGSLYELERSFNARKPDLDPRRKSEAAAKSLRSRTDRQLRKMRSFLSSPSKTDTSRESQDPPTVHETEDSSPVKSNLTDDQYESLVNARALFRTYFELKFQDEKEKQFESLPDLPGRARQTRAPSEGASSRRAASSHRSLRRQRTALTEEGSLNRVATQSSSKSVGTSNRGRSLSRRPAQEEADDL